MTAFRSCPGVVIFAISYARKLLSAVSAQNCNCSLCQDLCIGGDRAVTDVLQIQLNPLVKHNVASAGTLPVAGDAAFGIQTVHLVRGVLFHFFRKGQDGDRPGSWSRSVR